MSRSGKGLLALVAVCAAVAAALAWQQRELPAALSIELSTPLESGSEIFLVELLITDQADGGSRTSLLAGEFLRADQVTELKLPAPCCSKESRLKIQIVHPGYRFSEFELGQLGAMGPVQSIKMVPTLLVDWLEPDKTMGFMEVQAHLDRSSRYMSLLKEENIARESAINTLLTDPGLRQLMNAARFKSATEKAWGQSEQRQKMLSLHVEFNKLYAQLFEASQDENGIAVEMATPSPL